LDQKDPKHLFQKDQKMNLNLPLNYNYNYFLEYDFIRIKIYNLFKCLKKITANNRNHKKINNRNLMIKVRIKSKKMITVILKIKNKKYNRKVLKIKMTHNMKNKTWKKDKKINRMNNLKKKLIKISMKLKLKIKKLIKLMKAKKI